MTPLCHIRLQAIAAGFLGLALASSWGISGEKASDLWSLQPITAPLVPESTNGVDFFIQKKLSELQIPQNQQADPHTLLRRATLSVTGLPPTLNEISDFTEDQNPAAYAELIDRLLASPHYGERWGRHWLDIARYVQGAIKVPGVDEIDLAIPYRDYVVSSLNEDKPFDQFIAEQLAGDLLAKEAKTDEEYFDRIVAPAFLSIGQWFDECTDPNKLQLDIVDEQISTTTRAFLAMDFACSRCHDHKFDPIPTRDYYALAGIFRSTEITSHFAEEWKDGRPRRVVSLATPKEKDVLAENESNYLKLLQEREKLLSNLYNSTVLTEKTFRTAPSSVDGEILTWEAENFMGHKNLKTDKVGPLTVMRTRKPDDRWIKYRVIIPEPGDYTLLARYAAATSAPVTLEFDLVDQPGEVLTQPTYGENPDSFVWRAIPMKNLEKGSLHIRLKAPRHVPFPALDQFKIVRGLLDDNDISWRRNLGRPTLEEAVFHLTGDEKKTVLEIENRIQRNLAARPKFPKALAVTERSSPVNLPVHVGGDVYRTESDSVPRSVPGLVPELKPSDFTPSKMASGRLELAQWLAHPDHPLTARVIVNRIWHWHFGTGIVRTTDDFGKQGSPPTHPELLDWLAAELIESGWSLKHIHRIILNSETFRASSKENSANRAGDPDAKWLSRYPRRRLEAEAIYDGMLTSIGKVPRQNPGTALDTNRSKDRALYILTSSRSPVGLGLEIRKMFTLFGVDDSGRPMHDRDESTTAKQALWWLNNPLPRYYADEFARQLISNYPEPENRAEAAQFTILGKPFTEKGRAALLRYVNNNMEKGLTEEEAWARTCLALFSSQAFSHIE